MTETATPTDPKQETYKLQAELQELPEKIQKAKRTGDTQELMRLRAREEIIPVSIKKLEIDELDRDIQGYKDRLEDAKERSKATGPAMVAAQEAAQKAQEAAREANAAHGGVLNTIGLMQQQIGLYEIKRKQLLTQLDAM
jgi:chromosome segregation ATPase